MLTSGHEGLKEHAAYEAWKKEQFRLQQEVAGKLTRFGNIKNILLYIKHVVIKHVVIKRGVIKHVVIKHVFMYWLVCLKSKVYVRIGFGGQLRSLKMILFVLR